MHFEKDKDEHADFQKNIRTKRKVQNCKKVYVLNLVRINNYLFIYLFKKESHVFLWIKYSLVSVIKLKVLLRYQYCSSKFGTQNHQYSVSLRQVASLIIGAQSLCHSVYLPVHFYGFVSLLKY